MDVDVLYDKIRRAMIGRLGMTIPECELLAKHVGKAHLEIGTLWGGSAIFSALAGADRVYSLDHMHGGWWADGQDPKVNPPLGPAAVIDNLYRFDLAHRVTLVVAPSNPFPLKGLNFDTALIDGDHTFEGVSVDWQNVKAVAKDAIMFHDCSDAYPGVMKFIKSKQPEADGWECAAQVETLRVYVPKKIVPKPVEKAKEDEPKPTPVSDRDHSHDSPTRAIPSPQSGKPARTKRP